MKEFFLLMDAVSVRIGENQILKEIDFQIGRDEQWIITGPSGSGKSVLARVLAGQQFYSGIIRFAFGTVQDLFNSVVLVEQQHRFKDNYNQNNFYYQQRFNSCDADRTLTVREEIAAYSAGDNFLFQEFTLGSLLQLFQIDHLLEEPLIQLSNGENKRLQIIKALLKNPRLLILDNPFLGLDPEGRKLLNQILNQLHLRGLKFLLIDQRNEIPECFTHLAVLEKGSISCQLLKREDLPAFSKPAALFNVKTKLQGFQVAKGPDFEFAVRMLNSSIRYGGKEILSHVNWIVRKGDKCCITGPNGSGKSTLLSLINGDNPQAYANEIYLFDRLRGSGESIWDIKKRIGFVSPEMHMYFDHSASCSEIVASGLFDTVGLFRQLSDIQTEQVMQWMDIFDLRDRKHQLLSQLPAGEQRLVLLARALIKCPSLLVLDEPCQGLDDYQTKYFKSLINQFCDTFNTTLIYVSHNLDDVPESINHFLRIENGKIVSNSRLPEFCTNDKNKRYFFKIPEK